MKEIAPPRSQTPRIAASLPAMLATPQTAGVCRTIVHSMALQYLDASGHAAVERAFVEAGARADADRPLARIGFDTLGLQTYLTVGPKEARAWTIRKGWKAPQAAGVIHTDFERGFIKAETVAYDDLVRKARGGNPLVE